MELTKGMKIKQTKVNGKAEFANTTANGVLMYEVVKVNKNTYSLKCIEGYMKGTGCKLVKDFAAVRVDEYGTCTMWEVVA